VLLKRDLGDGKQSTALGGDLAAALLGTRGAHSGAEVVQSWLETFLKSDEHEGAARALCTTCAAATFAITGKLVPVFASIADSQSWRVSCTVQQYGLSEQRRCEIASDMLLNAFSHLHRGHRAPPQHLYFRLISRLATGSYGITHRPQPDGGHAACRPCADVPGAGRLRSSCAILP
jgi:hypothetical protein